MPSSTHVSALWAALVRIRVVDWIAVVVSLTALTVVVVASDFHFVVATIASLELLVVAVAAADVVVVHVAAVSARRKSR